MAGTVTQAYYDALASKIGAMEAITYTEQNNISIGNYTDVIYPGMDAAAYGPTQGDVAGVQQSPIESPIVDPEAADVTNKYNPYDGLKFGENRMMGEYGLTDSAAWFGGKNNTGILSGVGSAIGAAATIGKTALAYKQFQQNKINDAIKLEEMKKSNIMKEIMAKNKVNQARRYAMLGMGNSNNQVATMNTINTTPYTSMRIG